MNEDTGPWGQHHFAGSKETAICREDDELCRVTRATSSGCDLDPLIDTLNRLERERDEARAKRNAYAETLREILEMDPDWTVIAKLHPEIAGRN